MPVRSISYIQVVASNIETFTLPLDMQLLKGAALSMLSANRGPTDCFGSLMLLSGGVTRDHAVAVLAAGYLGTSFPIGWDGNQFVDSDMFLMATVQANSGDEWRLGAIVWPFRVDEKGEFRADP